MATDPLREYWRKKQQEHRAKKKNRVKKVAEKGKEKKSMNKMPVIIKQIPCPKCGKNADYTKVSDYNNVSTGRRIFCPYCEYTDFRPKEK